MEKFENKIKPFLIFTFRINMCILFILSCMEKNTTVLFKIMTTTLVIQVMAIYTLKHIYNFVYKYIYQYVNMLVLKKKTFKNYLYTYELFEKEHKIRYRSYFKINRCNTNELTDNLNLNGMRLIEVGNSYISTNEFNKKQTNEIRNIVQQVKILLNYDYVEYCNML